MLSLLPLNCSLAYSRHVHLLFSLFFSFHRVDHLARNGVFTVSVAIWLLSRLRKQQQQQFFAWNWLECLYFTYCASPRCISGINSSFDWQLIRLPVLVSCNYVIWMLPDITAVVNWLWMDHCRGQMKRSCGLLKCAVDVRLVMVMVMATFVLLACSVSVPISPRDFT